MRPLGFAMRSLLRQPARALLGVLGIAIVGALLFDMLLLSRGLVHSLKEMMDQGGYDVRVTATGALPGGGPVMARTAERMARMRELPEIEDVAALRFGSVQVTVDGSGARAPSSNLIGFGGPGRGTWTVVEGDDLPEASADGPPSILVNRTLAARLGLGPGSAVSLRGLCRWNSVLPQVEFRIAGIVDLRFDTVGETAVCDLAGFAAICSDLERDHAGLILAAPVSGVDPERAAEAIGEALPDLRPVTNQQLVNRLEAREFSYYRQISIVLSSVTVFFAFLLIATLLTVSVNQRLGEVAALRALGFPRRRIVADLLCESALFVGVGGLGGFPLGALLARWLDGILRSVPGVPIHIEFFMFQPRAVVIYATLLAATGLLAAVYPVWLAARLPIAATLRREILT